MGLADAMFEMGIRYDSDEGLAFGRRIAELFTREAYAASEALARQRGEFPNYTASLWQTKHSRPMRNAAVTTIAPTGTLSILAGCSGGIEPAFALAFVRHVLDGAELREVNSPFRRYAQARGFWSDELAGRLARGEGLESVCGDSRAKEIFVTAHEVAPQWHVRMQAEFQKYIDGAISKTINLPSAATPQDVDAVYRMAFELRCKGVTVYRDGCRAGQPMTTRAGEGVCPRCHAPMSDEGGCARCTRCGATLCS
jgi:ribonucleoside-diphosphate reductase alpha chain